MSIRVRHADMVFLFGLVRDVDPDWHRMPSRRRHEEAGAAPAAAAAATRSLATAATAATRGAVTTAAAAAAAPPGAVAGAWTRRGEGWSLTSRSDICARARMPRVGHSHLIARLERRVLGVFSL